MPKTKPTKVYDTIRNSLHTGDIVLFSGKGGLSAGIKWATTSRWSHVAMVFNLVEYNFVTLWESTTLTTLEDLDTKKMNKGVQLIPLSDRVQTYEGEISIRRLSGVTLGKPAIDALMALRKKLRGRPYEKSTAELIKAAYDGPFGHNEEDLSSVFCSELVAESYQVMGLLPGGKKDKPSNEYVPADFSQARTSTLGLLQGNLGPEIPLRA